MFDAVLNRRRLCALAGALLASTAAAGPVFALTPQEKHVSALTSDVITLAHSGQRGAALQKSVARMLNRHSNMSSVARFALGPYGRKLPATDKKEYYGLVERYVAGLFAQYVGDFAGSGVDIQRSRQSGKFVIVESRIRDTGTLLKWRVYSRGSAHRVADVNFRGIWLSIRMRDQFVSVLKKNSGDFRALMDYLRANS